MGDSPVVPFEALTSADRATAGGKDAHPGRSACAGLPVRPGRHAHTGP